MSAAQIQAQADVHNTQYETRSVAGGSVQDEPYVGSGLTIKTLLANLAPSVDPSSIGFTRVTRNNGGWATLSGADIATASDFTSGLTPVLMLDGPVLSYIRPLRQSSQDTNAADLVRSETIDLYLHTGSLLHVTASANNTNPAAGASVTFTATSPDAVAPATFTWDFGDGTSTTGANVTHVFTSTGGFTVQATVDGANDSAGAADPLTITVGSRAISSPQPSTTPRPGGRASPAPVRSSSTPAQPHSGTTISAAPATAPSDPAPDPSRAPTSTAPHSLSPTPAATSAPPASTGPVISGRLISEGAVVASVPSQVTAQSTAAHTPSDGGARPLPAVAGGTGVLLLLLLGAVRELRGRS